MSELKARDFKIHIVPGDGNCGPRAISVGIYGTQEHHGEIRQLTYEYMLKDYG